MLGWTKTALAAYRESMSEEEIADAEYDEALSGSDKSHQSTSLQQLFALQKRVFSDALSVRTDPMTRCSLVKAWDVLEERKRILRNKPLPGSLNQKTERKATPSAPLQIVPTIESAA